MVVSDSVGVVIGSLGGDDLLLMGVKEDGLLDNGCRDGFGDIGVDLRGLVVLSLSVCGIMSVDILLSRCLLTPVTDEQECDQGNHDETADNTTNDCAEGGAGFATTTRAVGGADETETGPCVCGSVEGVEVCSRGVDHRICHDQLITRHYVKKKIEE